MKYITVQEMIDLLNGIKDKERYFKISFIVGSDIRIIDRFELKTEKFGFASIYVNGELYVGEGDQN